MSAVKINSSHIHAKYDPHSLISPGLSVSLWLCCNVIDSPTFFAVRDPWRECWSLTGIVSDKSNNIWLWDLQTPLLKFEMCRCKRYCGFETGLGVNPKRIGRVAPRLNVVMERRTYLCICYMCVYTDTLAAIRGFSVASQISWQPHGAPAVKQVVINNSFNLDSPGKVGEIVAFWGNSLHFTLYLAADYASPGCT